MAGWVFFWKLWCCLTFTIIFTHVNFISPYEKYKSTQEYPENEENLLFLGSFEVHKNHACDLLSSCKILTHVNFEPRIGRVHFEKKKKNCATVLLNVTPAEWCYFVWPLKVIQFRRFHHVRKGMWLETVWDLNLFFNQNWRNCWRFFTEPSANSASSF